MQATCMHGSQRRVQHMQQESVQQLLAEKGAYQEQDNLQRLFCT
jgi:hypothetical protein